MQCIPLFVQNAHTIHNVLSSSNRGLMYCLPYDINLFFLFLDLYMNVAVLSKTTRCWNTWKCLREQWEMWGKCQHCTWKCLREQWEMWGKCQHCTWKCLREQWEMWGKCQHCTEFIMCQHNFRLHPTLGSIWKAHGDTFATACGDYLKYYSKWDIVYYISNSSFFHKV